MVKDRFGGNYGGNLINADAIDGEGEERIYDSIKIFVLLERNFIDHYQRLLLK